MAKILGLTQSSFDPASRFRFIQFIPHLEKEGWIVDHRPNTPDRQWKSSLPSAMLRALHYRAGRLLMKVNRLSDLIGSKRFDVAFVNRDFAAEGPRLQKLFRPIVCKTVFDFDDAIFVGPKEPIVRWMCENSAWITPGNEYLAKYARQFNERVTVIPTVIDTDEYIPRTYESAKVHKRIRVGWSGSDQSIRATLVPHLEMLSKLQARVDFELVVVTNTRPELPISNLRWTFHAWSALEEPLLGSKFDIGIMPLLDDEFQKGKCALKLLQYMAAGLPTVASPVGVNADILQDGTAGMLARNDADWHRALECLISNHNLRAEMGRAGRALCEQEYSVKRWLPVLIGILEVVQKETCRARRKI